MRRERALTCIATTSDITRRRKGATPPSITLVNQHHSLSCFASVCGCMAQQGDPARGVCMLMDIACGEERTQDKRKAGLLKTFCAISGFAANKSLWARRGGPPPTPHPPIFLLPMARPPEPHADNIALLFAPNIHEIIEHHEQSPPTRQKQH